MIIVPERTARTLLIVDDHAGCRSFARTMFAAEGFEVTDAVADAESALAAVREQHPDVVLLDVQLPGIDGFEVARRLSRCPQPPLVVLMSSRERSDYGTLTERAPVQGFLPKRALSGRALVEALAA